MKEIELEKIKSIRSLLLLIVLWLKKDIQKRLSDSIETVMRLSEGILEVDVIGAERLTFSQHFACPEL